MRLLIFALTALLLTGCYDKVELEERAFAGALSVDYSDEGIVLGIEPLSLSEENDSGDDDEGRNIGQKTKESLAVAMIAMNDASPKTLSYGLSKAVIFGEELLEDDEQLKAAAAALVKNGEICGKLLVMATRGEASELLKNEPENEKSLGFYIQKHYKNAARQASSTLMLELETFAEALRRGDGVLIPLISFDDESKRFEFSGAAVVKEGLMGFVEEDEINGLCWVKGLGAGRILHLDEDDERATLRVSRQRARISFYEDEGLVCRLRVNVQGVLEENTNFDAKSAEKAFAKKISDEIRETQKSLAKLGIDGYGLADKLQKRAPRLHEMHGGLPDRMVMDVEVRVRISN